MKILRNNTNLAEHSTLTTRRARENISEVLNNIAYGDERVVVTSHGTPKAAIVSIDDLRILDFLDDHKNLKTDIFTKLKDEMEVQDVHAGGG